MRFRSSGFACALQSTWHIQEQGLYIGGIGIHAQNKNCCLKTKHDMSLAHIRFETAHIRFETATTRFETANTRFETANTRFETANTRFEKGNARL